MTKKQLIEALEGLSDDAEIHVYCKSDECGIYAYDVYSDDKVTGDNIKNEITLVAHF